MGKETMAILAPWLIGVIGVHAAQNVDTEERFLITLGTPGLTIII